MREFYSNKTWRSSKTASSRLQIVALTITSPIDLFVWQLYLARKTRGRDWVIEIIKTSLRFLGTGEESWQKPLPPRHLLEGSQRGGRALSHEQEEVEAMKQFGSCRLSSAVNGQTQ